MGEAKRRATFRKEHGLEYAKPKTPESNWGEDRTSHSLIVTKEPPPSLVRMREALQLPFNRDIYNAANLGNSFEECIGIIAAKLSVALDGYYDVPDLCDKLAIALTNRAINKYSKIPMSKQFGGLIETAMIEKEDSVELMEFDEAVKHLAGGTEADTSAPYTVCNSCITSFTCCEERKCILGKEVTQLGKAVETVDMLKRTIN